MQDSIDGLTKQEQFERYKYLQKEVRKYDNFGMKMFGCAAGTFILYMLSLPVGYYFLLPFAVGGTGYTAYLGYKHIKNEEKIKSKLSELEKSLGEELK